ncbi:PHP domain-containing protein [Acidobacteria bacterium AH-259-L09]|nr:PHP domain-containing protein [Acidobacteria bacterium AH-259-L09]
MKRWLKAELHAHTADDPADGNWIIFHSAEKLIDRAGELGFDVLSVTNHDQMLFSPSLREYAKQRGVLLVPGVEATLAGKHVLLYNFPNYDSYWDNPQIVARHKGPEQLVIAPHPFFPSSTSLGNQLFEWLHFLDGIEYNHFYLSWLNFNRRAEEAAQRFNLPLVGNSDVHHLFQLGRTYTLVYAEKEISSVVEAIKLGNIGVITHPVSPLFVANWFARAAISRPRYAMRVALSLLP